MKFELLSLLQLRKVMVDEVCDGDFDVFSWWSFRRKAIYVYQVNI